ncbi:MAG TPA: hypothetical protein VGM90_09385 [Kofleriaceae bacterium]
MNDDDAPRALRVAPLLAGVLLLVLFMRVGAYLGFRAEYGTTFLNISSGETRLWLSYLVFGLPGVLMIAWGLGPVLARRITQVDAWIQSASRSQQITCWVALFAVAFLWAAAGNHFVLLGEPITDDEHGVMFGARLIAGGHLHVATLQPAATFNEVFTFQRAGTVTSMDYPGGILFAAASLVTRLGALWYALAAALTAVAVAYAARRWFGLRAGVLAALIWFASPMASALSLTHHAHLASRLFVALALAAAARFDTSLRRADALWFGLACGLAFLCRPPEATCVLMPLAFWLAAKAWREARASVGVAAIGFAIPLAVFAWWNMQTTGVWYLPARFAGGTVGTTSLTNYGIWDRLAYNVGFNAMLAGVFFLGPLALPAVVAAARTTSAVVRVLLVCVVLHLLLGLAHDDTGIHTVGPIHLSESAVPLTLLVTVGALAVARWAQRHGGRAVVSVCLAGYLASMALLQLPNLASLHDEASANHTPHEVLAANDVHHAIVIAMPPIALFRGNTSYTQTASWALHYPIPDPWFRDDVLFAEGPGPHQQGADPVALHARFPDRTIWFLRYTSALPAFSLSEWDPAAPAAP